MKDFEFPAVFSEVEILAGGDLVHEEDLDASAAPNTDPALEFELLQMLLKYLSVDMDPEDILELLPSTLNNALDTCLPLHPFLS